MAKTAQTLVSDALRWLGAIDGDETASATELTQGLDALNGMMFAFGPRGIAYAHTTLAATDTVNVPDEQIRNVMFMLANELAPEYEIALNEQRAMQINDAMRQLEAAYFFPVAAASDEALRPRWFGSYSIVRID
jgi:hypothetical protein